MLLQAPNLVTNTITGSERRFLQGNFSLGNRHSSKGGGPQPEAQPEMFWDKSEADFPCH